MAIRPLSKKYVVQSKYIHTYSNILLNIAQTTQYCTFVVYLTSFSRDAPPRNRVAVFVIKEYGRGVSTNIHGLYVCEGLTEGIAFVVKCKKSKIR